MASRDDPDVGLVLGRVCIPATQREERDGDKDDEEVSHCAPLSKTAMRFMSAIAVSLSS